MDDPNPYSPPRSPLSESGHRPRSRRRRGPGGAARAGAIIGSSLLVPAYLALFVMGQDPNGGGSWGWCPGSVASGIGVGSLYGILWGGGVGWVVDGVHRQLDRGARIGHRDAAPLASGSPGRSTRTQGNGR